MSYDPNQTLGEFLRSRRDSTDPAAWSLPRDGRRRAPGVRREELALRAGVSVSYYVRIEQGAATPSPVVLDAIARALELSDDDRRHILELAQSRDLRRPDPGEQVLRPDVEQFLRSYQRVPIGVLGRAMRLLGWNRLGHLMFGEGLSFDAPWSEPDGLNWARRLFCDDASRRLFVNWDETAIDLVGRLRSSHARHPTDPETVAIVEELTTHNERFAQLWHQHPVRERPLGEVHLRHPTLGELHFRDLVLRPSDDDDQLVILFQPEPASHTEQVLTAALSTLDVGH